MPDAGLDGEAVVNALANRAGVLMAELAVKDVQLAQLQARIAELEAAAERGE